MIFCVSRKYLPEKAPEVFAAGQRVRHSVFGEGTVFVADLSRKAYTIRFDSLDTPREISFRAQLSALL